MPEINIEVRNKIAEKTDDMIYVCNNSDYIASFDFDSEWDAYNTKTARFSHDGQHTDVVFTGNQCNVPVITNTYAFHVGVFAGDLHTTTAARVPCRKSILCGAGAPANPTPDVYNQLMELIKGLGGADPDAIAKAVADYLAAHPIEETDPTVPEWAKAETKPTYTAAEVGAISQSDLQASTDAALAQAKSSGEFDGAPGPAGPQGPAGAPGKDGAGMDITGASVGQIAKIAAVDAFGVPTAWSPVDMPSGGGDPQWIEVVDITTEEQTQMLTISVDKDGRPISQYNALGMIFTIFFPADATQTSNSGSPWIYPFPKTGDSSYRHIADISAWKTIDRTRTLAWEGLPRIRWTSAGDGQATFDTDGDPDFLSGVCVYLNSSGDHIPVGTKVRIAVLSRGVTM